MFERLQYASVRRTWNQFVDCVKRYTDLCFTENKRKEFNKAVESPVDLVHQMCTSPDYQKGLYFHYTIGLSKVKYLPNLHLRSNEAHLKLKKF